MACIQERLAIKSGLQSRAAYDGAPTVDYFPPTKDVI
jgi:hypothetical protein